MEDMLKNLSSGAFFNLIEPETKIIIHLSVFLQVNTHTHTHEISQKRLNRFK